MKLELKDSQGIFKYESLYLIIQYKKFICSEFFSSLKLATCLMCKTCMLALLTKNYVFSL